MYRLGTVDRVTRLRPGRSGVRIPVGARDLFLCPQRLDPLWAPHSLLFDWYRGSFSGVRRPGCEFNQSASPSTEVRNEWGYGSAPSVCLQGLDKENFTIMYMLHISVYWYSALGGLFEMGRLLQSTKTYRSCQIHEICKTK